MLTLTQSRQSRPYRGEVRMNKTIWSALAILAIVAVGAGGYWYGTQAGTAKSAGTPASSQSTAPGGSGASAKGGTPGAGSPQAITVEAMAVVQAPMPQSI